MPDPLPSHKHPSPPATHLRGRPRGYWVRAARRLAHNRLALLSAAFALFLVLAALLAPLIAPYPYSEPHFGPDAAYSSPSWRFLMGTDDLGRDLFSRILYSLRNALTIALVGTLFSTVIGGVLGAWAGYAGGRTDYLIMRCTDVVFAFPSFLFSIILVSALGRGFLTMFIAVAATSWVGMARLMRGLVITIKNLEYVEMARALGAGHLRILTHYILPNTLGPLIVTITLGIPGGMMVESGLSFLGMGVQPPTPSFGTLIMEGAASMRAYPHLMLFPSLLFALTLLAFTYLGDGMQDAFIVGRNSEG